MLGGNPMIQSRRIRYFLAAANRLHFSAAAAELHISQPALSRSIRQLEERLGVPLFERAAKGVVLTRYGELLARRVRLMELDAEHTIAEIEAIKTGTGGTLRIGAGPVWMRTFLPPAVVTMQRQRPEVQIDLWTGVMETHLSALMNGKIDLLCGDLDFPNHPELVSIHLIDLEFVIIAGKKHPLAGKASVTAEELLNYPWILLRNDYLGRNRFGGFFAAQSLAPPKAAIMISPTVDRLAYLALGDYLSFIPKHTLDVAERNDCVRIEMERAFWVAPHGMVYRRTNTPEASLSAFVSIVKDHFKTSVRNIRATA